MTEKENNDDLIIIKRSKSKRLIGKILSKGYSYYLLLLKSTTLFWTKIFTNDSRIRLLLESDAIVLFFNTLLFAFVGRVFGGLIGRVLIIVCFCNIMLFLFHKMEWITKANKKK
jgi:hypothetical protein